MAMSEAVLDAGPLIHLAELNTLDILRDLDVLRIPNVAWEEVANHQPQALQNPILNLQRVAVPMPSTKLQTLTQALALDRGETESLCLMELFPTALFLTDDSAARLAAEQLGYHTHGTIGLLIRSVRRRLRQPQEILALLQDLPERSTLFIRPNLLEKIITQLEKEWNVKSA